MLGLSANEVLEELNNDFCALQVSEFLEKSGFLQDKQPCMTENLQRLIFLQGNQEEVYTVIERKFIEQVGEVYVFPEFYKKTKHRNAFRSRRTGENGRKNRRSKKCRF